MKISALFSARGPIMRGLLSALLLVNGLAAQALTNQLEGHPSPYLALHASDPVAWQDWSPATVALARREQKLLYLSIGYFSCHWCHVMQKESYKDRGIARLLNENYVPVKIDRELEPALDARLIEFAQKTQGRAGWPLNVFLTPDGHPLYAVLYVPPEGFRRILTRLDELWSKDPDKLAALAAREARTATGPGDPSLDEVHVNELVNAALSQASDIADTLDGGFGQSTKFPMAPQLAFLMERYRENEDAVLGAFLTVTLDGMADGGMYDQIGDGFFRYSTDPGWETPHFEKMLYDNAQLAVLYLRAAGLFDSSRYLDVAARTFEFMMREMSDESGAMFASFSAVDDKDIEGGYYLWQQAELSKALDEPENRIAALAWGLRGPPRFEAGHLPVRATSAMDIAKELGVPETRVLDHLAAARDKLINARSARVLPVDTKLLAGWNGLALAAFSEAAASTGNARYRQQAQKLRDYILMRLWDGNALHRAVDGTRRIGSASLEDYAYAGWGLWVWFGLTGDPDDAEAASKVVAQGWRRFYDDGWRMGEASLIAEEPRRDLIPDGPMASPAALLVRTTLQIARRSGDTALEARAISALNSGEKQLEGNWFWHVTHIQTLLDAIRRPLPE